MADVDRLAAAWRTARALRDRGDVVSARALLDHAVEASRGAYREDDPELLAVLHGLADLHRAAGDPAAARRTLEAALAAGERRLGDTDPLRLAIAYDLGAVAAELGNRHEARRNFGLVAAAGAVVWGADDERVRAADAYLGDHGVPAAPEEPAPEPPAGSPPAPTTALAPEPGRMPRPDGGPTTSLPPDRPALHGHPASAALRFDRPSPTTHPAPPIPAQTFPAPTVPAPTVPPRPSGGQQPRPSGDTAYGSAGHGRETVHGSAGHGRETVHGSAGHGRETVHGSGRETIHGGTAGYAPTPRRPDEDTAWSAAGAAYPPAPARPVAAPPLPQTTPTPKSRGRGATVAAVVAAVAAVAAAAFGGVALLRDDPVPAPVGNQPTASVPTLAGKPPTDLELDDQGDRITLTWTDPSAGTVPFVVAAGHAGEPLSPMAPLKPGATSYTTSGLSTRLDYCFTVVAYYSVNEFATSGQVCTKRSHDTPTPR
jgi:hypothetical protein